MIPATIPGMSAFWLARSSCYAALASRTAEHLAEKDHQCHNTDAAPTVLQLVGAAADSCASAITTSDTSHLASVLRTTLLARSATPATASALVRDVAPHVWRAWKALRDCYGRDRCAADPVVYHIARALARLVKSNDVSDQDRSLLPDPLAAVKKTKSTTKRFVARA
jgi:hypothetical protein